MRLLALDQSTQLTGWAFFIDATLTRVGLIDLHKQKNSELRCRQMCAGVRDLLTEYRPDVVVLEDVVLQRSPKTMKLLAMLLGNIAGSCEAEGIAYRIQPASAWRSAIGLNGGKNTKRAEFKARAVAFCLAEYGIEMGEDVAEAVCMGATYYKTEENAA